MRCGLFGKLLAKRDFVSIAAPRHFLRLWEPWIGNCLTHSRAELGDPDWSDSFVEAPIWRFFLGADLCGSSLIGAFMPSIDAVGRYFPLTLVAQADPGTTFATPDIEPYQSWFEAGEDLLLSALDASLTRDAVDAVLKKLDAFQSQLQIGKTAVGEEVLFAPLEDGEATARPLADIFATTRAQKNIKAQAASYWWTLGGENYRPRAFLEKSMPDPSRFTAMLTEWSSDPLREQSQSG
jgi:type VI secretion system protein ImpM